MKKIVLFSLLLIVLNSSALLAESVWDKATPELAEPLKITVYRSPDCSCCGRWLEHMKKQGFEVTDIKTDQMSAIKKRYGVPPELVSCHTAIINDYVIEGHVPAGDIKKLIQQHSPVVGLAVPGMVQGSPGMEMGNQKKPFSVISFDKAGKTETFSEYSFY